MPDAPPVPYVLLDAERYAATFAPDVIPLIRPASPSRLERWIRVLDWYGCVPLSGDGRSGALRPRSDVPGQVVAIGAAAVPSARVLAERTGRYWTRVDDAAPALRDRLVGLACDLEGPLVLVGRAAHFNAALIAALNAEERADWSVLTAADEAGLAYVAAKALAWRAWHRRAANARMPIAVVDAIDSTVREVADGHRGDLHVLDREAILRIVDGEWSAIVLRAHGEGTHAQLHSAVLCSTVDSPERLADGRPADGCREEGGVLICKRVHDDAVRVVRFSELRAAHVAFYSCNSFSVAAELYPSDLSAVVALSEGYAVSVLGNDRAGSADHVVLDAAALRIAAQGGQDELWRAENGRYARIDGARPWVRFGDVSEPHPAALGDYPTPFFSRPHGLPDGSRRVLCAGPAEEVEGVLVGQTSVGVLTRSDASPKLRDGVHVKDVTSTWLDRWRVCQTWRRRCMENGHFLRTARHRIPELLEQSASARAFARLEEVQEQVDDVCGRALDALERSRRTAALGREADLVYDLLTILIDEWDRRFAMLASAGLMRADLAVLLEAGRTFGAETAAEECARCRRPRLLRRLQDPARMFDDWFSESCTVCGPSGAWSAAGPRLRLSLLPCIRKGDLARVDVEVCDSTDSATTGILLLVFKDKGTGRTFYESEHSREVGDASPIDVLFPSDLTSDLHTLRALWIGSMAFTYVRARAAATPGGG